MEEVGIVIKCANQIYGIDAGRKKQLAGWGCLAEGCLTGWGSRSAIRLIRFLAGEVGCGLASAFLAILPVEDRPPRDQAGDHPPCGLQDEKEEKDAGTESQQTGLDHERCFGSKQNYAYYSVID